LEALPDRCAVLAHAGQGGGVLVSPGCRDLRRELRPLAWIVLEDVALDAVVEDGRLVARTSARRLAEQLGIDPGTAASALRRLRHRGLLALERDPGPAGRFGLAVYVLSDVDGLAVVAPDGKGRIMAEPYMVRPCVVEPDMVSPDMAALVKGTAVTILSAQPATRPGIAVLAQGSKGRSAPVQPPGQGELDLGLGTS
jgi:hypothetical protein